MARQPDKINAAVKGLAEGKTTKEIIDETGCSKSTVTIARKKLKDQNVEGVGDEEGEDYTDEEINESVGSFIKQIKIKPDPKIEDGKTEDTETEYGCGKCGHEWKAGKKDIQNRCPGCGVDLL